MQDFRYIFVAVYSLIYYIFNIVSKVRPSQGAGNFLTIFLYHVDLIIRNFHIGRLAHIFAIFVAVYFYEAASMLFRLRSNKLSIDAFYGKIGRKQNCQSWTI